MVVQHKLRKNFLFLFLVQKFVLKEEASDSKLNDSEKVSVQKKDAIPTPVMETFIQILIKIIDNLFLSKVSLR